MMYIAEKTNKFWPEDPKAKYEVVQWVLWQMGNQGPKMGEHGHFARAEIERKNGDLSYSLNRFANEIHRLYGVLNLGLHNKDWLAAHEYTIADMICYPWCTYLEAQGEDINDFKYFKRWWDELSERPGLKAGMAVGSDMTVDTSRYSPEEIKQLMAQLFNQRARPAPES